MQFHRSTSSDKPPGHNTMLVITIITSTPCEQGLWAKPPFLATFIKHRPCDGMRMGWLDLFNALINNAFHKKGGQVAGNDKNCIGNTYF
ncbi:hypothetical protein EKN87_11810 [Enterobacter hormaechei]|uniref:Uncharacterized protein n=1 Tax=Enterobacter hormaechei TaxID=158836 RepID=A0AAE9BHU3_9ENTR|nr:hypothetical protein CU081_18225 [Enterobacter sp. CRENT-193]AVO83500.1 hypothetical protein AM472_14080 [Enterobacter cloacae complex sp.]AXQ32547.1 hypothetical protein D0Z05_03715 [Enterobacter hormaechei]NIG09563.1 hypothetical protein [Enterobacter sp. Cy-1797]RAZ19135.1 hypothetical protein DP201_07710 [Enterobacter hormaechei subsp. xiangfangensis]RYA79671.1 hypothetical protein DD592_05955 [Enterobacter cloacae complex sp. 2DZ2F20B]